MMTVKEIFEKAEDDQCQWIEEEEEEEGKRELYNS